MTRANVPPLPTVQPQRRLDIPMAELVGDDPPPVAPDDIVPAPVLPLAYMTPATATAPTELTYRRPGRLVTVGILSVLFGVMGMLFNGAVLLAVGLTYQRLRPSTPVVVAPSAPAVVVPPIPKSTVTAPHDGDFVRPGGLKRADRDAVMAAIAERVKLPPDRAILLERFLRDVGRDAFFPGTAGNATAAAAPLTKSAAAAAIRDAGQLTSGIDGSGPLATHFLDVPGGQILLQNSLATFTPSGGGVQAVLDGNLFTDGGMGTRWGSAALNEWVDNLRRNITRGKMTGNQAAVLIEYMAQQPARLPRSGYRDDYGFVPPPQYPISVSATSGLEVITANLNGGYSFIFPDGRVAPSRLVPYGFGPGPAYTPNQRPVYTPTRPSVLSSQYLFRMRVALVDAAAGLTMNIMLLAAGICTLADFRPAARLHRVWAVLRLPFCIGAAAMAFAWGPILPGVGMTRYTVPLMILLGGTALALSYPVTVLLVTNTAIVRNYYRALGHPTAALAPGTLALLPRLWARATEFLANPLGRTAVWTCAGVATLAALAHAVAMTSALIGGPGAGVDDGGWQGAGFVAAAFVAAGSVTVARGSARRATRLAGAGAGAQGGAA